MTSVMTNKCGGPESLTLCNLINLIQIDKIQRRIIFTNLPIRRHYKTHNANAGTKNVLQILTTQANTETSRRYRNYKQIFSFAFIHLEDVVVQSDV